VNRGEPALSFVLEALRSPEQDCELWALAWPSLWRSQMNEKATFVGLFASVGYDPLA
jgi:hypothetical protein